jgi:hypothetical protein
MWGTRRQAVIFPEAPPSRSLPNACCPVVAATACPEALVVTETPAAMVAAV